MNYHLIATTHLFHGMHQDEIESLLEPIGAYERTFAQGELIMRAGDTINCIGLVERGAVNMVVNFWWGDSHIFGHVGPGETFGHNFAAVPGHELACDIVALEESLILFMDMDRILNTCQGDCDLHRRLIHNIVRISASKNLELSARMVHIAPKTIRGRMLSYLSSLAAEQESTHVRVPFTRQQLADYLGVDRSALSNELSKMRRDGLIAFRKNDFTLLEAAPGA